MDDKRIKFDDESIDALYAMCERLTNELEKMLTHDTKMPTLMLKNLGYGNTLLQVLSRFSAFHIAVFAYETENDYRDLLPSFISELKVHLADISETMEIQNHGTH